MATGIEFGTLDLFPETKVLHVPLPAGDRGIALTIGFMRQAAEHGQGDPQIRQLALKIVASVPNNDTAGELAAIYRWVKANIAFRGELDETVQSPEVTLKFMAGDCDDFSVLIAALAGALGYQWDFKTVALSQTAGDFTHVYPVVEDYASGQWVPLDATVEGAYPGWEPAGITRAATWKGLGMARFKGLGDDNTGDQSSGQNAAQQISDVLTAATPIVYAFRDPRDHYTPPRVYVPPQPTRPAWLWPAVIGLGALTLYHIGQNRGLRR